MVFGKINVVPSGIVAAVLVEHTVLQLARFKVDARGASAGMGIIHKFALMTNAQHGGNHVRLLVFHAAINRNAQGVDGRGAQTGQVGMLGKRLLQHEIVTIGQQKLLAEHRRFVFCIASSAVALGEKHHAEAAVGVGGRLQYHP